MIIHPKARTVVSTLSLPSPIKKYFSNIDWEVDLSNNTNPYMEEDAEYPDILHQELKKLYLSKILAINPPPHFDSAASAPLSAENMLFTVGSMEGIDLLLRTFAEPNKDVIGVIYPDFSAYEHWALIHNLKIRKVPLVGEDFYSLMLEDIIQINPKLVFLSNPNNPTGMKLAPQMIETLCTSIEGFVVVDEAYIEFSDCPSSLFHLNKFDNLIVLRTLSKAWGLAGVRCGLILADKRIINSLRYIQLPFGVSTLSQNKVKERLLNSASTYLSWQRIKESRDNLMEQLSQLESVTKIFKSQTNFIMVVLKDFQKTMGLLKKHNIFVLDCSASVPNSIRVSVGNEEQNKKFLDVISF